MTTTNPLNADSDGDGISDGEVEVFGLRRDDNGDLLKDENGDPLPPVSPSDPNDPNDPVDGGGGNDPVDGDPKRDAG